MTEKEVYDLLVETGAIMNGHFKLTSGLHSPHTPNTPKNFARRWLKISRTRRLKRSSGL